MKKDLLEQNIANIIEQKIKNTLGKSGNFPELQVKKKETQTEKKLENKNVVSEALVVMPGSFVNKSEKLSKTTKESHENLYRKYSESFNKISSELDAANKYEAGSYASLYRTLKMDECYNLNAIKLHELYFTNIADLASEITVDSLPYIKLCRDFGTFEKWQFDFIACAMSSREGWAMTVYEPYKNVYMNICIDGHTNGIPVGAVPVLVIDMWSHSFYKDYQIDKRSYLLSMMKEINWDVVEARMALSEKSDLNALYFIKPIYNDNSNKILNLANIETNAPIQNITNVNKDSVPPSAPAIPTTENIKG
jgi:Fe-Mn family superoxide dismutase